MLLYACCPIRINDDCVSSTDKHDVYSASVKTVCCKMLKNKLGLSSRFHRLLPSGSCR